MVKSLYGLCQEPRLWYSNLAATLVHVGLRRAQSSDCLFIFVNGHDSIYIVSYLNDPLLMGPNAVVAIKKRKLKAFLSVYDLAPYSHYE